MAWQTPKTNWTPSDAPTSSDFNKIEGNINYIEEESRTPSQTETPAGSGKLSVLLNYIATMIKSITGKTNWYNTPDTTLAAAKNHMDSTSPHGATSAATANRIMLRDGNGRAKVAAPAANDDIARKDTVDIHANNTNNPHSVTKAQVGLGSAENKTAAAIRQETGQLRVEVVSSFPAHADGRVVAHTGNKRAYVSIAGEWV